MSSRTSGYTGSEVHTSPLSMAALHPNFLFLFFGSVNFEKTIAWKWVLKLYSFDSNPVIMLEMGFELRDWEYDLDGWGGSGVNGYGF